jgi:hypothetical protein
MCICDGYLTEAIWAVGYALVVQAKVVICQMVLHDHLLSWSESNAGSEYSQCSSLIRHEQLPIKDLQTAQLTIEKDGSCASLKFTSSML